MSEQVFKSKTFQGSKQSSDELVVRGKGGVCVGRKNMCASFPVLRMEAEEIQDMNNNKAEDHYVHTPEHASSEVDETLQDTQSGPVDSLDNLGSETNFVDEYALAVGDRSLLKEVIALRERNAKLEADLKVCTRVSRDFGTDTPRHKSCFLITVPIQSVARSSSSLLTPPRQKWS